MVWSHVLNPDRDRSFRNPPQRVSVKQSFAQLSNLTPGKAVGPDGLPSILFKRCARELAPVVSELTNWSLEVSEFPDSFRVSRLVEKCARPPCSQIRLPRAALGLQARGVVEHPC